METIFRQLQRGIIFLTVIFIAFTPASSQTGEIFYVGKFSDANPGDKLPAGWQPFIFKNIDAHTSYSLVKDGDTPVIQAVSKASCSGLIRKNRINPEKYPIIQWRWKASNIYRKGDIAKKEGDDSPARIWITFEYDTGKAGLIERAKLKLTQLLYDGCPPCGALVYIWASKAPVGTITPNPRTDRVKMIVVESGKESLNTWITEERNLFDDYVAAFGVKPPMISGIAIMTDSDNTKESATAFYGDILFRKK
jgi:hypothetical protein